MKRAVYIILAALTCMLAAACGRCLNDSDMGGGGAGGPDTSSSTSTGSCSPVSDNDPVMCAANHCAEVSDGCGGTIRCDTLCTMSPTPASCGLPGGAPTCVQCMHDPKQDVICTNPDRSYAYVCTWNYPQPGICEPKSNDGIHYTACCGGPK